MFIGHFGVGFGAKRMVPLASLGTLFLACQLADLIWPTLVLLGVERVAIEPGTTAVTPLTFVSYPYSHSLLSLTIWGVLFALVYMLLRHARPVAGVTIAGLVLSHWILDVITHRPDMPVTLHGTARLGLGLWNSLPATVVVEILLFASGVFIYVRTTRAIDRIGRIGLWALVAFLLVAYAANLLAPVPPGVSAVAWGAESMWLLVAWGYWIDRHRERNNAGR